MDPPSPRGGASSRSSSPSAAAARQTPSLSGSAPVVIPPTTPLAAPPAAASVANAAAAGAAPLPLGASLFGTDPEPSTMGRSYIYDDNANNNNNNNSTGNGGSVSTAGGVVRGGYLGLGNNSHGDGDGDGGSNSSSAASSRRNSLQTSAPLLGNSNPNHNNNTNNNSNNNASSQSPHSATVTTATGRHGGGGRGSGGPGSRAGSGPSSRHSSRRGSGSSGSGGANTLAALNLPPPGTAGSELSAEEIAAVWDASDAEVAELAQQRRQAPLYTVIMMCLTVLFVFADQNVMAPNLTQIAREFKMSNDERDTKLGGYISAAFFLIGAPVALIVGYFTDKFNRPIVFAIVVLLGEIPCFCSGFASNYTELFITRALTGIAIGGAVPLVYSLLGDLFNTEQRSLAAAAIGICMGGGILLGQIIGGLVGPPAGWRVPFFIVAAPAIVFAVIVLFTVKDPPRGQQEEAAARSLVAGQAYSGQFTWRKVGDMLRTKTNILVYLTCATSTIPWGAIFVFANDFLAENRRLGPAKATWVVVVFGVGSGIGVVLGGYIGQKIYNASRPSIGIYMALTTAIGVIPMALLFEIATPSIYALLIFLALFAGALLSAASANTKAVSLNVNLPEVRGTAFAMVNIMDDLGKGLGPMIFAAIARGVGRPWAMNISMMMFVVTACFIGCIYWTLEADEDRVQAIITQQQDDSLPPEALARRSSFDAPLGLAEHALAPENAV